jgi:ketosteroid isomerase-like protein
MHAKKGTWIMDMSEAVSAIERLENDRYAAMLGKDVAALERLLHADLVYMHSSGVSDTKASYTAGLANGIWDYKRIERLEQTVKVHGDLALVFNRLSISMVIRGVPKELDNRALAVWVSDKSAWRLIALQSGVIPQPGG